MPGDQDLQQPTAEHVGLALPLEDGETGHGHRMTRRFPVEIRNRRDVGERQTVFFDVDTKSVRRQQDGQGVTVVPGGERRFGRWGSDGIGGEDHAEDRHDDVRAGVANGHGGGLTRTGT